jgi:hypothetical protein
MHLTVTSWKLTAEFDDDAFLFGTAEARKGMGSFFFFLFGPINII